MADRRQLVFLAKIRNGISHKDKTTWANTDSRVGHNAFLEENIGREIAIGELTGGDALKDFLEYMEMASEGAKTKDIQSLTGLMGRQPIAHNGGPIGDWILKLLIYGAQQMHDAGIKIERIGEAFCEFVRKQKEGRGARRKITSG